MAVPEPNSPEALRAAQKVRNIFYMIAAANFVIIAIVMWPRPKLPDMGKGASSATVGSGTLEANPSPDPAVAEMEAVLDGLLSGYHARDAERFAAGFARTAVPKPDEEFFRTVIIEHYADPLGELTNRARSPETKATPEGGVLVSEFTSKKAGKVRSRASFIREDGKLRIQTWNLEKLP